MKKLIMVIFTAFLLICLFPMLASAEEVLKVPTVQYKLINHDEIALRWTEVEGADGYCIYRTDTETGKTVKYKNTVKGTTVEVKGLKAETEYIFQVAAVSESNEQTSIGRKSRGTNLTTPKEWYCNYYERTVGQRKLRDCYIENYSKTIRQKFTFEKKYYAKELIYYKGWIYFICRKPNYTTLPWTMNYVGRIREDGTGEEVLFDDLSEDNYSYKVYGDHIYLDRYDIDRGCNFDKERITYMSDYYRVSMQTCEVSKICDVYLSNGFDIYGDYIYFVYDPQEYNKEVYGYVDIEDKSKYLGRVKVDGTEDKEILYKLSDDIDYYGNMYIYEDEIYFYREFDDQKSIIKIPLSGGDPITVCENTPYIDDFEVINGYIYFTEYEKYEDLYNKSNPKAYCRIKTDGTDMIKRSTPFKWRY